MPLELMKESRRDQPDVEDSDVRVYWGTVFSGAFMMLAFGLCSVMVGNAIGLSPINVISTTAGSGLKFFSWLYTVLALTASYFAGGYTSLRIGRIGRAEKTHDPVSAALHGLTAWAISGVFIVAYGIAQSTNFRQIIAGNGPNAVNWLILFTAVLTGIMSAAGASRGRMAVTTMRNHVQDEQTRTAA